jgi:translocator protein
MNRRAPRCKGDRSIPVEKPLPFSRAQQSAKGRVVGRSLRLRRIGLSELASTGQLRAGLLRWALLTVPLCIVLGFVSGALSNSGNGNPWYDALEKPWFLPPGWVFPVAWTTLYILLGIAVAIVLNARGARRRGLAVALFVAAFAFNIVWSPVFFGMHLMTLGLWVLAGMFATTIPTAILFWQIRRVAGLLILPYLVWLCVATALNYEIRRMNPGADGLVVDASGTQIDLQRPMKDK